MGKRKLPRHKTRYHKAVLRHDNLSERIKEETRPVTTRTLTPDELEVLAARRRAV